MFIGYYKSVVSSNEFYSKKRDSLDFPMQVELDSERYLLVKSIQISSLSQEKNIINTAKKYGIQYDVRIEPRDN